MTPGETPKKQNLAAYWPFWVCGGVAVPLAQILRQWMPYPFAAGACMFVGFATAFFLFQRVSGPTRRPLGRSIMTSLVSAFAGGAIVVVLAFLLQW